MGRRTTRDIIVSVMYNNESNRSTNSGAVPEWWVDTKDIVDAVAVTVADCEAYLCKATQSLTKSGATS